MNVYEAKATFRPTNIGGSVDGPLPVDGPSAGSQQQHSPLLLPFSKGELFEILETDVEGKSWWGARAFKDNNVGYVPAGFFKKKNIPRSSSNSDLTANTNRELHLQALAEMQQKINFKDLGSSQSEMIPDPDYSDSDEERDDIEIASRAAKATSNGHSNEDGIIMPKKLPNPCMESKDRKNLHKELMFNQKIGKNVLNQKSELRKVMDKFQDDQRRKEHEQEQLSKKTVFEKKMEEQAKKLEQQDVESEKKEEPTTGDSEFMRVHAKLRARMDVQ